MGFYSIICDLRHCREQIFFNTCKKLLLDSIRCVYLIVQAVICKKLSYFFQRVILILVLKLFHKSCHDIVLVWFLFGVEGHPQNDQTLRWVVDSSVCLSYIHVHSSHIVFLTLPVSYIVHCKQHKLNFLIIKTKLPGYKNKKNEILTVTHWKYDDKYKRYILIICQYNFNDLFIPF